jgi:hypothetical protein
MPKFSKKPVEIEAYRFDNLISNHRPFWLIKAIGSGEVWYQGGPEPYLTIKTLEGEMRANEGDWIIRGVQGELYPCKPDIFAATYTPAEDSNASDTRQIVEQRDALREALAMAENAVQAHLDMVNVIQKWNALPIPAILETAQHNCPIVLEQVRAALAKLEQQP